MSNRHGDIATRDPGEGSGHEDGTENAKRRRKETEFNEERGFLGRQEFGESEEIINREEIRESENIRQSKLKIQDESSSRQINPLEPSSTSGTSSGAGELLDITSLEKAFSEIISEVYEETRNAPSPINYWSSLITDEIIHQIVEHTNTKLAEMREEHCNFKTNHLEIKSLVGLHYMCGFMKYSVEEFYTYHQNWYNRSMTEDHFGNLTKCLSFSASEGKTEDVTDITGIRKLWGMFNKNCAYHYSCPPKNCTIGGQLLTIPKRNSPEKEELMRSEVKFIMMNNSKSGYMIDAILHTRQELEEKHQSNADHYLQELSRTLCNTESIITTDNLFTSRSIVKQLLTEHSVTMIGTLEEEKVNISQNFKRIDPFDDTVFVDDRDFMIVKYEESKNNNVLLSSHKIRDDVNTAKPKVIDMYEKTKGGTELFNTLCHQYAVSSQAESMSLHVFYAMLNQAGVNSLILYNHKNPNEQLSQKKFLLKLSLSLIQPHINDKYKDAEKPPVLDLITEDDA